MGVLECLRVFTLDHPYPKRPQWPCGCPDDPPEEAVSPRRLFSMAGCLWLNSADNISSQANWTAGHSFVCSSARRHCRVGHLDKPSPVRSTQRSCSPMTCTPAGWVTDFSPNCEQEGKTDANLRRHIAGLNRITEHVWPEAIGGVQTGLRSAGTRIATPLGPGDWRRHD